MAAAPRLDGAQRAATLPPRFSFMALLLAFGCFGRGFYNELPIRFDGVPAEAQVSAGVTQTTPCRRYRRFICCYGFRQ